MSNWAERLLGVIDGAEVPDLEELADGVGKAEISISTSRQLAV